MQTQPRAHSTNGTSHPHPLSERAVETAAEISTVAKEKIDYAATKTARVVKANPLKAVAISLGVGAIAGAMAHAFFGHTPTWTEALNERIGIKRRLARLARRALE